MARDMLTHGILYKDESHHVDDDEDTKGRGILEEVDGFRIAHGQD